MMDWVRKGKVDWTGDNPPIYLKTDPEGDWSCLALWFRIAASEHGRGHLMLVVENPYGEGGVRLGLTDNRPLADWLMEGWVRRFGLFRPAGAALDAVEMIEGASFSTEADYPAFVAESARGGGRSATMRWNGLQEMFAVAQPRDLSATGRHEMFSVFQPASSAEIHVDGRRLPGQTVERDFMDRRCQSAALAHGESWIVTE